MKKILIIFGALVASFISGYVIGSAKTKVKIVEKKAEIIKNVAQKKAIIQAEPNASRDELLELMRSGEL